MKKNDFLINTFVAIFLVLFLTQLLLPKDSSLFIFKSAFFEYSYVDKEAPTSIELNSNEITVNPGGYRQASYTLKGDSNISKLISYKIENEKICSFVQTTPGKFYIIGKSTGSTTINIYSAIDSSISKSFTVNVLGEEQAYSEMKYVYGIVRNGLISYSTSISVNPTDDVKIFLIKRDTNGEFHFNTATYSSSSTVGTDSNGNIIISTKSVGATNTLKATLDGETKIFSIKVFYPDNYKRSLLYKYLFQSILYVLSFVFLGVGASMLPIKNIKNKKLMMALFALLFISPFVIMVLNYFILYKRFFFVYWIISPLAFYVTYGIFDKKGKTLIDKLMLKDKKKIGKN